MEVYKGKVRADGSQVIGISGVCTLGVIYPDNPKKKVSPTETSEEREAKAYVIAAAYDTLEACEMALGALRNHHAIDLKILERAIAKARR